MLYEYPLIQVRNTSAIIYNEYVSDRVKIKPSSVSQDYTDESETSSTADTELYQKKVDQLRSTTRYQGVITPGVQKRIKKAVCLLLQSSEKKRMVNPVSNKAFTFQVSFVTLTIPSSETVSARVAQKQLLEPMLRWMRNKHQMHSYIWKVEQQKRGQLHYHITCDAFIHYQELRNYWNKLLTKADLNIEYRTKYGHIDANSTDIHSVKHVKNLQAYLIKYLSKTEQNGHPIDGKVWDCSMNLKKFGYYTTDATSDTTENLLQAVDKGDAVIKYEDHYTIIITRKRPVFFYLPVEKQDEMRVHLWNVRNWERSGTVFINFDCTKN